MAGDADSAADSPTYRVLAGATALGCAAAAYLFAGAPGIWQTPLSNLVTRIDPALGWLPAVHFLFSAVLVSGGIWLSGALKGIGRPGLVPLALFSVFQFGLLVVALTNFAIGIAALRHGELAAGICFVAIAVVALRIHPDLYMSILRQRSWVRSFTVNDLTPAAGGGLVALTIASNLVPLALTYQSLTMHSGAVLAALFRGAAIDSNTYWSGLGAQILSVTPIEQTLALAAAGCSIALAGLWAVLRVSTLRRIAVADRIESALSPEQIRFIDDALPATIAVIEARASESRYVIWAFFWMLAAVPALLAAGYAAYMWFDLLQERHALSWVRNPASDFVPFASSAASFAQYVIPAALALIAATMSAPFSRAVYSGARFDQFAFGQPMREALRAKLSAAVASGASGPGQPFDAESFAYAATRRSYWLRVALAGLAVAGASASGFWDVARGVAFTSAGVIVQENFFSPPQFIEYREVEAVSVDCRADALGARPVYELILPGGRVVDMIGDAPLPERLDQYLAVDRRLQFSGVGYAYPPGDLEPCLKAIQHQHNSVIAAGTARLLHVLD